MSVAVMYFFLFNVLILISPIAVNPFEIDSLSNVFYKLCGTVIGSIKKLRDDFTSFLSCVSCSFEEKREEFRKYYKQFFNDTKTKGTTIIPPNTTDDKNVHLDYLSNISNIARRMVVPKSSARGGQAFTTSLQLDIVSLHGYQTEVHTVITPDGYLLTLHRITHIQFKKPKQNKTRIAILHHGLLGSSIDWVLLGPNFSLPYMLINAGYDVWLANARGNRYSKAHLTKSVHSSEYWDFSWHEIGLYDLSSTIDYIKEKGSSETQICFVAHSMGATALMVLLSSSPQYNTVLNLVILLAPLVFMQQAKGPFRFLSEFKYLDHNTTVEILGGDQFNISEPFMNDLVRKFCTEDRILCKNPLLLLSDGGKTIINARQKQNVLTYVRAGGSVKTILHFCQLINSGRFEMLDGGSTVNIKKYGIASPPQYRLKDIKLPIVIFNSDDDWLSTTPDILNLLSHLPNAVTHHIAQITSDPFSHFDFVWSVNAPELVYKVIFDILD